MNYRHGFHAGNFADVVKHLVVSRIIEYLKRKPAPFLVLDTHAGRGGYRLDADAAQRTGEWRDGIGRLWTAPLPADAAALAAPYLETVRAANPEDTLRVYPGSPLLVRQLLRPQDRLAAAELHPEEAAALRQLFAGDRQVTVMADDGWQAVAAVLPPPERRGLVLIDPPFEQDDEWERLAQGLVRGCSRFATGTYALWYPLKDPAAVEKFVATLASTGLARVLRIELAIRRPSRPPRLFGSGLAVVNPPFVLEAELQTLLPALVSVLSDAGSGQWRLDWISGEAPAAR